MMRVPICPLIERGTDLTRVKNFRILLHVHQTLYNGNIIPHVTLSFINLKHDKLFHSIRSIQYFIV